MPRRLVFVLLVIFLAGTGLSSAQTDPNRLKLTVAKGPGGDLQLSWQDSCGRAGTDYGIHEGSVGSFTTHTSAQCGTTGATTFTVTPGSGDRYYLVTPLEDSTEGSYGHDSDGAERPVGLNTCFGQQVLAQCLDDNFVDADPARRARLDEVLDAAAAIIAGGGSYTDVANMLAGESDVTGVFSNEVSMYFSVDGLSTTIYDAEAARHGGPLNDVIPPAAAAPATVGTAALTTNLVTAATAQSMLPRGQRMVGTDDDGDGFRDLPKHALILSPWEFEFAPNDSAPELRDFLLGIRDYQEGSVTYKSNTQNLLNSTLKVSDYLNGWESQDIIFLSSHGDANPNAVWGPDPYLFMGIGGASCSDIALNILADTPEPTDRPGLRCVLTSTGRGANKVLFNETIGTRAFWQNAHGGRLHKKLIYAEACKTAAHPGLAEALTGTDSIFFGWSDYVQVVVSLATADKVFRETVEDGFPVLRSFVRECASGTCANPPEDPDRAELLSGWHRADLRTREALHITDTPVYAGCAESPTLPVEQTCPSCGGDFPMNIVYNISLDGLEPQDVTFLQDPFDFGKYQLRLFADVDDIESGYALPLTDLNMIDSGNGSYVHFPQVTLFMDNVCPYQVIEYNPWVLLPAFDETMPGNDARDRIYSWDAPFTFEIVPTFIP